MNDNSMNALPVPAIPRHPEVEPGEDLTAEQRQAARLALLEDKTQAQVAQEVGVSLRTVERWRAKPAFKRYTRHLVTTLVEEEAQKARAILAKNAPAAARKLAANAVGGKPSHPYEIDAGRTLLDRVLGTPVGRQAAVALEVDDGDRTIRIIVAPGAAWSSRADWRAEEEGQEQQE